MRLGGEIRGFSGQEYAFRTVETKLDPTHSALSGDMLSLIRAGERAELGVMDWCGYKKELCVCPAYAENIRVGKSHGALSRAESSVLRHLTELCSMARPKPC